ncbi:Cache domain-containing protein [Cohnella sp. OV330]|uniref:sensor histidine kinase n=1 Tax=Cohnella sp. OV330 TaxID=1855288 RepID=UPI0008DF3EEA|nr:sensor histidine kinase [Cohnella sp. OV330]SFB49486.1 Cache domain-containing protein [Cohnella sp. OV330]
MKLKRFKRFPRTLVAQILLLFLIGSLLPLVSLGLLNEQATHSQFAAFSQSQMRLTEKQYIDLYESYLAEQVNAIDSDIRKVEVSVLSLQSMAETIFSHPERYRPEEAHLLKHRNGYWYTPTAPVEGRGYQNLSTLSIDETIRRELTLSTLLNPLFRSESERNSNLLAMYYIHPKNGYNYYSATDAVLNDGYAAGWADLSDLPYYQDALSIRPGERRVAWTQPYRDATSNNIYMFTATAPVYDKEGRLRGVVAADVSVQDFVQNILDAQFNDKEAFAVLLDSERHLIAAQRQGEAEYERMRATGLVQWNESTRYAEYSDGGETQMLFTKTVPSTGWTLAYIIPKEKLLREFASSSAELADRTNGKLLKQNVLITLLAAVICTLLALFLWKRIARPIGSLSGAFIDLGNGDFSVTIKDNGTQEFHQLLRTFNRMSGRIRELLNQQVKLTEELEATVQDRTAELKIANEELELRIDELTRLESWRRRWISHISHDLKTPAAVAKGYIEAILSRRTNEAQAERYLFKIDERIETISSLVKNLNDLSLLETKQVQPNLVLVQVDALFGQLLRKWADPLSLEGRRLQLRLNAAEATIRADEHLLGSVVDNMMSNAIKYSAEATLIAVSSESDGEKAVLRFMDEGIGIPQESLPFIFDSFYRVDASRNSRIPGSGLGLAIAKEIMLMHGGTIEVEMNEDRGCTFSISIPINA